PLTLSTTAPSAGRYTYPTPTGETRLRSMPGRASSLNCTSCARNRPPASSSITRSWTSAREGPTVRPPGRWPPTWQSSKGSRRSSPGFFVDNLLRATIIQRPERGRTKGATVHILCPHCRNPIEVVKLTPREEIVCPACGSTFRLETDSTTSDQP